jgi:hypothetical protein
VDINKHITGQRIRKIIIDNPDRFSNENDGKKKSSKAFVCLSAAAYLNIEPEEAFDLVIEGGNAADVDANLFERANKQLITALENLYPALNDYKIIDKRRLSATFRCGDLLIYL